MTSHFFPNGIPTSSRCRATSTVSERMKSQYEWFEGKGRLSQILHSEIVLAASSDINVLIIGETGTGKEVVAQWIHAERKIQKGLCDDDAPFAAVNCAAIPDDLVESILFGHEKGAFTSARQRQLGKFELAHKGTLFLDEIQNLNFSAQSKLLRVVQSREFERIGAQRSDEVQCQIVTASNIPLEILVESKSFRKDLYYRLNICPIYLPALRNRKEDLPQLISHFLKKLGAQYKFTAKDIDPEAYETLLHHDWPGNLRELEHCLLYALMRAKNEIKICDLPPTLTGQTTTFIKDGTWIANEA